MDATMIILHNSYKTTPRLHTSLAALDPLPSEWYGATERSLTTARISANPVADEGFVRGSFDV